MKSHEEFHLNIPANQEGMIGRQCPRCTQKFAIDEETYIERGYLNLRCPYCKLIGEVDEFTSEEQTQYALDASQEKAQQVVEELLEDRLGDVPEISTDNVELTHNLDDIDLGTVGTESPHLQVETEDRFCDKCNFRYAVEEDKDGSCPVCRQ